MTEPIIDPATFRELQETAGADFVKQLVAAFLEEAPVMLDDMRAALAAGEAEKLRRAAHSFKGNCNTFGALGLAAKARELELGGLDRALAAGPQAIESLAQEYARVAAALTGLAHA
jgi:HPt (histidine-containing phosphotransfer) domain-containing protein